MSGTNSLSWPLGPVKDIEGVHVDRVFCKTTGAISDEEGDKEAIEDEVGLW